MFPWVLREFFAGAFLDQRLELVHQFPKVGHQQLRYAFDVCWKSRDGRQCRDYVIDLFPPFDLAGLAQPPAPVAVAKRPPASERTNRLAPVLATRFELLANPDLAQSCQGAIANELTGSSRRLSASAVRLAARAMFGSRR